METLLAILAGLILMSSLVKTGLLPIKIRLVVAVCYAVFIGCVTQRMTELSHEVFVQMTASSEYFARCGGMCNPRGRGDDGLLFLVA